MVFFIPFLPLIVGALIGGGGVALGASVAGGTTAASVAAASSGGASAVVPWLVILGIVAVAGIFVYMVFFRKKKVAT
jgi:LPXTG-motif cell wall-anchored protein